MRTRLRPTDTGLAEPLFESTNLTVQQPFMIPTLVIIPRTVRSQKLPVQASSGDFNVTPARNRSVTWLRPHNITGVAIPSMYVL